jgi:carboxylesterase type B
LGAALEGVIDTLVVETAYGNVRGFSKMVLGTKLYVFYGIPYAKAPVGKRRSVQLILKF